MTTDYEPWSRNELNKNSQGGTEVMVEGMLSRVDPQLLQDFQIIPSRVRDLRNDKLRVYWLHDLPWDPETNHLKNETSRSRFHKIVYCGHWQMTQYQNVLGVPHDQKTCVIETAIEPFKFMSKSKDEIRLIYTSTPQRGLELLIPVFEELAKHHDNIVLDVFSSYKIYGWEDADKQFESLYERCRQHPKINYHGFAPNSVVREHVQKAHIHAYPSIWLECNSKSLIEAMSAGALCVHPNYGGLADTSGQLTAMYNWDSNPNIHANIFYQHLNHAIKIVNEESTQNYLQFVKQYADNRFNWNKIAAQWTAMLQGLSEEYRSKDISVSEVLTFRTPG
jgi:glycosyltransferase involved in cell wall biosynthesis